LKTALKRIFEPQRDEVLGGWRKLHNEELHNLYSSPSIIRIIKLRRLSWTGHVTCMGRRGRHIERWWESQKERYHKGNQDMGWKIILKWILEMGWYGLD
jgi:hypothetical protein